MEGYGLVRTLIGCVWAMAAPAASSRRSSKASERSERMVRDPPRVFPIAKSARPALTRRAAAWDFAGKSDATGTGFGGGDAESREIGLCGSSAARRGAAVGRRNPRPGRGLQWRQAGHAD